MSRANRSTELGLMSIFARRIANVASANDARRAVAVTMVSTTEEL
jgi:hypothetical protein